MEEIKKNYKEGRKVTCNDVIVKGVSSPSSIMRVATDKGIDPRDVFVRVTFEFNGKDYTASNKLRYLTKTGYQELLDAQKNQTKLKFVVDVDNEFFYVEKDIAVDDLFATDDTTSKRQNDLSSLI